MAILNHYAGEVEEDTFSLAEVAVACPADGPVQELIGVTISIDRVNFKNRLDDEQALKPRIHVEFAQMVNGVLKGSWDLRRDKFVRNRLEEWSPKPPYPWRTVLGGEVTVSEIDGPQREHLLQIFQIPTGDWWIAYQGEMLGHYPADRFTLLNQGACRAHIYAEVYTRRSGSWTITDMGSGQFAEAGANKAAYFRKMMLLNTNWMLVELDDKAGIFSQPYREGCYSRTPTKYGGPLSGFFFFFSGPGADSPLCYYP